MNEQPRQMNVLLVCKLKLKHLTRHFRQMNNWQRQMNEQPRQMNVLLVCKLKLKHSTRHLNEPPRQMNVSLTECIDK